MGQGQSYLEEVQIYRPPLQDFVYKQSYNQFKIYQHCYKKYEIMSHKVSLDREADLPLLIDNFKARYQHHYLVSTLYLLCEDNSSCGGYYENTVFYQRVFTNLSKIKDIPFMDTLHFYTVAFRGFQILHRNFGYFEIFEDMFHIGQDSKLKVWCSRDITRNKPENYLIDSAGTEEDMIRKILFIVDENTDHHREPFNLKDLITSYGVRNFEMVNQSLREICRKNNLNVPERVQCLTSLPSQDVEALLDLYTSPSKLGRHEQEQIELTRNSLAGQHPQMLKTPGFPQNTPNPPIVESRPPVSNFNNHSSPIPVTLTNQNNRHMLQTFNPNQSSFIVANTNQQFKNPHQLTQQQQRAKSLEPPRKGIQISPNFTPKYQQKSTYGYLVQIQRKRSSYHKKNNLRESQLKLFQAPKRQISGSFNRQPYFQPNIGPLSTQHPVATFNHSTHPHINRPSSVPVFSKAVPQNPIQNTKLSSSQIFINGQPKTHQSQMTRNRSLPNLHSSPQAFGFRSVQNNVIAASSNSRIVNHQNVTNAPGNSLKKSGAYSQPTLYSKNSASPTTALLKPQLSNGLNRSRRNSSKHKQNVSKQQLNFLSPSDPKYISKTFSKFQSNTTPYSPLHNIEKIANHQKDSQSQRPKNVLESANDSSSRIIYSNNDLNGNIPDLMKFKKGLSSPQKTKNLTLFGGNNLQQLQSFADSKFGTQNSLKNLNQHSRVLERFGREKGDSVTSAFDKDHLSKIDEIVEQKTDFNQSFEKKAATRDSSFTDPKIMEILKDTAFRKQQNGLKKSSAANQSFKFQTEKHSKFHSDKWNNKLSFEIKDDKVVWKNSEFMQTFGNIPEKNQKIDSNLSLGFPSLSNFSEIAKPSKDSSQDRAVTVTAEKKTDLYAYEYKNTTLNSHSNNLIPQNDKNWKADSYATAISPQKNKKPYSFEKSSSPQVSGLNEDKYKELNQDEFRYLTSFNSNDSLASFDKEFSRHMRLNKQISPKKSQRQGSPANKATVKKYNPEIDADIMGDLMRLRNQR